VLASIPEAVAIEHGNHVLYTNPAFTRMFGYTAEEAGGGSLRELIVPEARLVEHLTLAKNVDEQGSAAAETVRLNKYGELVDVSLQMAPLMSVSPRYTPEMQAARGIETEQLGQGGCTRATVRCSMSA
jgi:PAS domain S-box-containing protein